MNPETELQKIQAIVRAAHLDGWLFYDFKGLNPFATQLLHISREFLTRRWFLYIPASGPATLIHHRIEATTWQQILPDPSILRRVFSAHQELDALLRETLAGGGRVAMEYSPRGEVPYVSYVDAGTVERVRECGVEIVSSADLLQHFIVWDEADVQAHREAVRGIVGAKDAAFQLLRERRAAGEAVTELEVQDLLVRQIAAAGLEFDHAPIVAFGSHASDGHYAPGPSTDRKLESGMCVLIDLWAGVPDRPMADITWVGFAGEPTAEYLRVWEVVRDARDTAVSLLTSQTGLQGWQVDRAARAVIAGRGFGEAFRHRLGHSLGRSSPHGAGANLDDLETHDTRLLLPGLGVTVEPGVYLGHLGVRSEINLLITASGAEVTTPLQSAPYRL